MHSSSRIEHIREGRQAVSVGTAVLVVWATAVHCGVEPAWENGGAGNNSTGAGGTGLSLSGDNGDAATSSTNRGGATATASGSAAGGARSSAVAGAMAAGSTVTAPGGLEAGAGGTRRGTSSQSDDAGVAGPSSGGGSRSRGAGGATLGSGSGNGGAMRGGGGAAADGGGAAGRPAGAGGGAAGRPAGAGGGAAGRPAGAGGGAAGAAGRRAGTGGASDGGASGADSGSCLDSPPMVTPAGYNLVWADEFNADGAPDAKNWGYESGFVRNEELQYYQTDNATVEGGCLIIEARREKKTNPSADYTSSSLRTMGKHSWQYGRFEMRGRIKAQAGLWPAWWTLGDKGEWPSCGEIDIMEYYAGAMRANVACGTGTRWQAKWDGFAQQVSSLGDKQWDSKFHVWRMDWNDQKIDLYLDDKLANTSNLKDMLNSDGSSPFKQPHYMILNLAVGGTNGGDPSKTAFPTRFEVDYVRVFQKE